MTKLLGVQRQTTILEILRQQGAVSIQGLSQSLKVSAMTVRRDLDELEQQGILQRTHGGAIAVPPAQLDPPFSQRAPLQANAKQKIARRAAELIGNGDRLILDSGSTVANLSTCLSNRDHLSVITYSMPVMQQLAQHPTLELICTGGSFDSKINAWVGPLAEQMLQTVRVDKAFLGATSISLKEGFSNSHLQNLTLQRLVLACAREVYLLADHSKFLRNPFWLVSPLTAIKAIITDDEISPAIAEQFSQAGIQLLIAT